MARSNKRLKILLAVDDSPYAKAALQTLTRLSPPANCELRLIHVVEPLDRAFYPELTPPFPSSLAEIQKGRLRHGQAILDGALEMLRSAGYKASGTVGRGHIRSTIVKAAETWGADIILLGSRGRTGLKRALLGSVSDHVARHAHCSVLIVR
jgi:nucleotide-binding universal stress UspA family protein